MDPWRSNSAIVTQKAAVSCDQPQATRIGLEILKKGGNAADAAIAVFAAVSVIQPMSCGIGGDCQCLFYKHSDKTVRAINGSGRTGKGSTLDQVFAAGITETSLSKFENHGFWVTVPGCVAGMFNIIKQFGSGKLSMADILEPAIKLAEEGVAMPYKSAIMWETYQSVLKNSRNVKDVLNGESPAPGELFHAQLLAKSFKELSEKGPEVFYTGNIAKNIVEEVVHAGGSLTIDDMASHLNSSSVSSPTDALYVDFHGFRVWEMKPSTIGIVVLVGLNVLNLFDLKSLKHNSADYIHILAETTKYAYLECWEYLCDPNYCSKSLDSLLSLDTAKRIKNSIISKRVLNDNVHLSGGNTSYTAVVDEEGNGCSFIFSVSSSFGTGIIPQNCGFVLHDRGKCMNLKKGSPNVYGPGKFPLHTIIPSLVTDPVTNNLIGVFGVIGRWMQPQGHIQVLLNMVVFGMDPQQALNQPRFFVGDPKQFMQYVNTCNMLYLEEGISPTVVPLLKQKGHEHCEFYLERISVFGKGHVIARPALWNKTKKLSEKSWWAGADPRSDGCASGL